MLNPTKTMTVWAKHADQLNITPPATELEYEKLLELLEQITDTVDDLERNPYSALLDLAMHYASLWEDEHEVITDVGTPKDVLEFWMDQHNTTKRFRTRWCDGSTNDFQDSKRRTRDQQKHCQSTGRVF